MEPVILQEKPKEKTVFNVKLEAFDAAAKPKIIREVKAMVPNLTLIEVRPLPSSCSPAPFDAAHDDPVPRASSTPLVLSLPTRTPFFLRALALPPRNRAHARPGEEVRRVATADSQGEPVERGRREAQKDVHGPRRDRRARVGVSLAVIERMSLGLGAMSASYILH